MSNLDNAHINQSIEIRLANLNSRLEQVIRTKDLALKLAIDRQQQITLLTKAGYEKAKLAAERQKTIDSLKTSLDQVKKELLAASEQGEDAEEQKYKLNRWVQENRSLTEIYIKHKRANFLHLDCYRLKREVAEFLLGDSPLGRTCVDSRRKGILNTIHSVMESVPKVEVTTPSPDESLAFLKEFDSLLIFGADQEVLIGKLNKLDCDPVYLHELLFIRTAELLAISLIKVSDYQAAIRIFSELLCSNGLDELIPKKTGRTSDWLTLNYDKQLLFSLLENKRIDEIVSFFNSGAFQEKKVKIYWYKIIGDFYHFQKNNMSATHYYSLVLKSSDGVWLAEQCVDSLVTMNQATHAVGMWLNGLFDHMDISNTEKTVLLDIFEKASQKLTPVLAHGHVALMKVIDKHFSMIKKRAGDKSLVLVEIGTTREHLKGQGSTEKLARFCNDRQIHFITVDMDPINSDSVRGSVRKINADFEVVTAKGEQFLADYKDPIDFVFLDAYDFDHGYHSEARQARYERNLGEKINDEACYKMHLDCAILLISKLSPWGIIGFDDVWFKDNVWTGKGTTAMPYLFSNGFKVILKGDSVAILVRNSFEIS
jgi:hypothetical protein